MKNMVLGGADVAPGTSPEGEAYPDLAGQTPRYLYLQLKDFKEGRRKNALMSPMAANLSKQDMYDLAEYFSKQKFHPTQQVVDAAKVKRGADLQEANCSRCHLEDGKEGKDDTPVMASQWLTYLQMQMALYQSGARKMPEKMAEKVKPLSKEDIEALLHFYASVK